MSEITYPLAATASHDEIVDRINNLHARLNDVEHFITIVIPAATDLAAVQAAASAYVVDPFLTKS